MQLISGFVVCVHPLVILHVFTGDDLIHPLSVVQVPLDGAGHTGLEGVLRAPAKLGRDLVVIDRVARSWPGAILDVYDKVFALAGVGENELDDLDIGSLVVAADVVHLAGRALFNTAAMAAQ